MVNTRQTEEKVEDPMEKLMRLLSGKLDEHAKLMNTKFEEQGTKMDSQATEMKTEMEKVRIELSSRIDDQTAEIKAAMKSEVERLEVKIDDQGARIDIQAEQITGLDKKLDVQREETAKQNEATNQRLDKLENQAVKASLHNETLKEDIASKFDDLADELAVKVDAKATEISERFDKEIQRANATAEKIEERIHSVEAQINGDLEELREKMGDRPTSHLVPSVARSHLPPFDGTSSWATYRAQMT